MTTIVYANNEMAWDSRRTMGGTVLTDTSQKRYEADGRTFWCAGTVGDFVEFTQAYASGKVERELEVRAFVLDAGKLGITSVDEAGRIWTCPVTDSVAIGSGADHAITAIDCGCTPAQAVRMAAKRDTSTGGKIRTQKLKLS